MHHHSDLVLLGKALTNHKHKVVIDNNKLGCLADIDLLLMASQTLVKAIHQDSDINNKAVLQRTLHLEQVMKEVRAQYNLIREK